MAQPIEKLPRVSDTLIMLPSWVSSRSVGSREDVAFCAGAALAGLHPIVGRARPDIPQALLRDRLALGAALNCLKIVGRSHLESDLRDEVHLLRLDEAPGPGGAVFLTLRKAARQPLSSGVVKAAQDVLPDEILDVLPEWLRASVQMSPVAPAASVLHQAITDFPREEAMALILADMVLAKALGWPHMVPLLTLGLRRRDFQGDEDTLFLACLRQLAKLAPEVVKTAADLTRRSENLHQVAPRLRAKGAGKALELFLTEDALSPSIALSPRIKGSRMAMSDRAARRLCDRLVALGVVREMTGRPSFRLYGL